MKLPRFTVRRLMIAAAVVGFGLECGLVGCRWWQYGSLAVRNELIEQRESIRLSYYESHSGDCRAPWVVPYQRKILEHHGFLKRKYQVATTHPWLSVAPDPPEPEMNSFGRIR
jgi:hypothetical protein